MGSLPRRGKVGEISRRAANRAVCDDEGGRGDDGGDDGAMMAAAAAAAGPKRPEDVCVFMKQESVKGRSVR